MSLSDIRVRATLKGTIFRGGGGGGVTSYNQLNDKPSINGVTIEGALDGNDYGLANTSDLIITGYNTVPVESIYRLHDVTIDGRNYTVAYLPFEGTDGIDNGKVGLVPAPTAADANKALFGDGTWKEITSNIDFTTTEQNTGIKWINNKILYQKTIIFKQNNVDLFTYDNNEYLLALPPDIDFIKVDQIYINRNGTNYIDIGASGNEVVIVPNPTTRNVYLKSIHNPTDVIITFQYTKQ